MSADLARVAQWMYSTLSGDATITGVVGTRIYAEEAPQEASYPLIVFAHIGNVDILRAGNKNRFSKNIYLVRAVAQGSSVATIKTVADRFDPLLLVSNVTVDGTKIAYVQHDQHHMRYDSEFGVPLSYLGSYYLVFSEPASQ